MPIEETTGTPPESAEVTIDFAQPPMDANIEKNINIAIEAQDGKAETPSGEEAEKEQSGDGKAPTGQDSAVRGKDAVAQPKPDPKGKEAEGSARGPKDLTLADGTVVKGGPERRWYEQMRVARDRASLVESQLSQAQEQLRQSQQKYQTLEATVQQVQGMPPRELGIAATIFRDLQRDPVSTLQKLLAEATSKGYNIEGIATGVDAAAIERIIEAKLGSSLTAQQGPTDAQIEAEAQQEANAFFVQFPDAKLHESLIARVLHDNPSVDLHTAYFGLRENFANRGFDWSRPLEEQLASSGVNEQQQGQQPNANGASPGLPNGRPAHVPSNDAGGHGVIAHESTSQDDIIKQAMRENGLQID